MPQATTKTYQLFRETLLNATSEEHKKTFFRFCGCGDRLCEECVRGIDDEIPEEIRPITLEDVLMALVNKDEHFLFSDRDGSYGCDEDYYGSNDLAEILKLWNLTKPAHLQSEETLLEIIKLFK